MASFFYHEKYLLLFFFPLEIKKKQKRYMKIKLENVRTCVQTEYSYHLCFDPLKITFWCGLKSQLKPLRKLMLRKKNAAKR